ncbi:TPA: lpg2372 family Dot/Icm T4SS effector, partial [Legionella pneumophila]
MKVKYSLFVIDKIKKYNYQRASNYRSTIMSTTIDEATKRLDNMVKLLKEFKKEVKAQKFKSERNFENSSTIFAEFNSELNELKKLKHHNLARVIVEYLGQVIEKNDLNMKLIITNKDTTQNIVELEMTSNLKKKEFYKKGIVIATDTSA